MGLFTKVAVCIHLQPVRVNISQFFLHDSIGCESRDPSDGTSKLW